MEIATHPTVANNGGTNMDNFSICPVCGGEGTGLGVLGNLFHCRCRNCGMTYSEKVSNLVNDACEAEEKINIDELEKASQAFDFRNEYVYDE